MSHPRSTRAAVAALLTAMPLLALTIGAAAQESPPAAVEPAVPKPAPGETSIPPVGTAAEDDYPRTAAERSHALRQLDAVARCVRARGLSIPDPVSNAEGVTLGWEGPASPELDAALRACHEQVH